MNNSKLVVFWFRRDLRLHDNTGLYHALQSGLPVLPVFIFDPAILDELHHTADRRVDFIHQSLQSLHQKLTRWGSGLSTFHSSPQDAFAEICAQYNVEAVYTNHDYEPYARSRDKQIATFLRERYIEFRSYKDQVIFETNEVTKADGSPYTIFTPYSKKWLAQLQAFNYAAWPSESLLMALHRYRAKPMHSLQQLGFLPSEIQFEAPKIDPNLITKYAETRDFPAKEQGTTRLSVHLRFGTLSIRQAVSAALLHKANIWLNELIWREFYMMILWHFPKVVTQAFKPAYDQIPWRNNEQEFEAWSQGKTGYPLVDAGIRQLLQTGFMHNRVRMVVASFLTKHLLINWRWGEAFFARHLLDFDLAANNGGWQWASSSGCDAAPYFRVFNPALQTERFDPKHSYIAHWLPEYNTRQYPLPIVAHSFARERAITVYKQALNSPSI